MNSKLVVILVVVILCGLGVAFFNVDRSESTQRYVADVSRIVRTTQTYDGEHYDQLVGLGKGAVPAIGRALLNDPEFPLVFVKALESIGDARGAEPILGFVLKQMPFSDRDRSTVTGRAIQALAAFDDRSVVGPLERILLEETAHIEFAWQRRLR